MDQQQTDKMSVDEHGTVSFDFTNGFDERDLLNVLNAANAKAAEHYRKTELPIRAEARRRIEYRHYAGLPGTIVHPDGVLEIPLS